MKLTSFAIALYVLAVVVLGWPTTVHSKYLIIGSQDDGPSSIVIQRMIRSRDSYLMGTRVKELKGQPVYVQVSVGEELVALLEHTDRLEWNDADLNDSKHDPRLIGGRAAYLLEQCYGFEIPALSIGANREEHIQARSAGEMQLRAFKEGILRARQGGGLEDLTVESLRATYQERILENARDPLPHAGGTGGLRMNGSKAFLEMLDRWYPLGKRLEDLERIVGRPAEPPIGEDINGRMHHYEFFHPRYGVSFRMLVENGLITAVDLEIGGD